MSFSSLSRCQEAETDHGRLEIGEETIEATAKYIYDHYQNPITLEEVAELSHMSPAYFSRKFKAVTGFGYKEYLTNIRIREASRLLLHSACSVTDRGPVRIRGRKLFWRRVQKGERRLPACIQKDAGAYDTVPLFSAEVIQ